MFSNTSASEKKELGLMDSSLHLGNPFANNTQIHPLVALLLAVLTIVSLSRKRAPVIASILIIMNLVTAAQRFYIGGMNFPIYRLMICIALIRIIIRREYSWFRPNNLDLAVVIQIVVTALASFLRAPFGSEVVYLLSTVIDSLGVYLITRVLIRDREDFHAMIRVLMWISFIVAGIFIIERFTRRNPMAVFGGVIEYTWVREGKLRVQGPYPHPILAGAFWATIVPLFLAASKRQGSRRMPMYLAAVAGVIIVILCSSSGPLVALVAGIGASVLYYQRNATGKLKAVAVLTLLALCVAWNKPIWYLLAKIDLTGGSTGYFRYYLVDSFIRNWQQWILIGTRTTANWGIGMVDVVNQYVAAGVNGGLLGFVTFIASIVLAFKYIGTMVSVSSDTDERRDYWCLGASLIAHLFNFVGVSYFSQIVLCWWITLAFCSSLYQQKQDKESLIFSVPSIAFPGRGSEFYSTANSNDS